MTEPVRVTGAVGGIRAVFLSSPETDQFGSELIRNSGYPSGTVYPMHSRQFVAAVSCVNTCLGGCNADSLPRIIRVNCEQNVGGNSGRLLDVRTQLGWSASCRATAPS